QRDDVVVDRHLLGVAQLVDDRAPQPPLATGPDDTYPPGVELVPAPPDDVAVEAHEEADLVGAPSPVLRGEGVGRHALDPDLDGTGDDVQQRRLPRLEIGRASC